MNAAHSPVIVGAGLAGCAAALRLARGGVPARVLERTATPQPRLCGEFISAEAVRALATLGVDVVALGGHRTRGLRLHSGGLTVEAELPFEAVGLSRQALDGALQARVPASGAQLLRGQRAALQQRSDAGGPFVLRLTEGEQLRTHTLLLATGKTDLAPVVRPLRREPEALVGWQQHLRLQPAQARALAGCVEVQLFKGGYAGLQPIEGDRVNLCLLALRSPERPGLQALLQSLRQEAAGLSERLHGAEPVDGPPRSIFRVPYGHLHPHDAADPPGLWRLGDQAAVIPSFTGDGMAIALHSGLLAADLLLQGATAAQYHARLRRDIGPPMRLAHTLYRVGRAAAGRAALMQVLRHWPGLAGFIAAMTRVPAAALRC